MRSTGCFSAAVIGPVATLCVLTLVDRFYPVDGYGYGFAMTAFAYSLVALSFAILVVAALAPNSWLHRVGIPGAQHVALWSYSLYLTHKAVAVLVHRELQPLGLPRWDTLGVETLACLFVGWRLYRAIELPFMQLRDRNFPTNFERPQAAALPLASSSGAA